MFRFTIRELVLLALVGFVFHSTIAMANDDAEEINGTWIVVSWSNESGVPAREMLGGPAGHIPHAGDELRIASEDGKLTWSWKQGKKDEDSWACQIDAAKEPKEIDLTPSVFRENSFSRYPLRGIYKLEGNRLTVCFSGWVPMKDEVLKSERPTKIQAGLVRETRVGLSREVTVFERKNE